jgi:hypothetical protein
MPAKKRTESTENVLTEQENIFLPNPYYCSGFETRSEWIRNIDPIQK